MNQKYLIPHPSLPITSDSRGLVFYPNDNRAANFHMVTLNPGAIRGNHIHENQSEILCVLGGTDICQFQIENDTGEMDTFIVDGDFQFYQVPPGKRHIVTNIGDRVFYLVVYFEHECL